MATHENTNPNSSHTEDIFTWLPELTIYYILSMLPMKTLLQLRSVSKACMSRISSRDLIETRFFNTNNGVFSMLPKVVIYNILLRLPVKTLLRLKSVSKSWMSLISSSDFVETHVAKSTNDPQFTHHHLLVNCVPFALNGELADEYAPGLSISLSLYSLLNEPDTDKYYYLVNKIMDVVGHCKGLVCLQDNEYAFLWNPCTKKSRRLPKLQYVRRLTSGFCYDESNDDFKVVTIVLTTSRSKDRELSVYSSKTDCWRMIGDFPFKGVPGKGMFTNGAMHWAIKSNMPSDYPKSIVIVSFDIKTETFREVLPPKYNEGAYNLTLGTFDKNLSVCELHSTQANLWVMKKYGAEESWIKLFTIRSQMSCFSSKTVMYANIARNMNLDRLKPIHFLVNGDIIVLRNSHMQLYNSKDKTYKELFETGMLWKCDVYTYVESLVSPLL